VIMGPHTFNFAEAAQLAREAGAALRVESMEEAMRSAASLASDPTRRDVAVRAAIAFAAAHQGAAERTAKAVLALIQK
jgi:3-deoxy-D-manno-octulosonic-acid transferase